MNFYCNKTVQIFTETLNCPLSLGTSKMRIQVTRKQVPRIDVSSAIGNH